MIAAAAFQLVCLLAAAVAVAEKRDAGAAPTALRAPKAKSKAQKSFSFQETIADTSGAHFADVLEGLVHGDLTTDRALAAIGRTEADITGPYYTIGPVGLGLGSFIVWALAIGAFAWYYQNKGGKEQVMEFAALSADKTPLVEKDQWRFGLFTCLDEPKFFLFTCLCGTVRWADSISMVNLMEFTAAVGAVVGLTFVTSITSGLGSFVALLFIFATVAFYAKKRQELRKLFNLPNGDTSTMVEDFLTYCFCGTCAVLQEARQVEAASKDGTLPQAPSQIDM
eukprot:TRINITY_DN56011_c0_g1_i1.p1 TRINITY_DN56011_c0_g1~~TRINITY_DN56011_c0_g1_i1.p1  ORF type:complete len:308 (-),score=80.09 TRINITY_DN56011_c0_g1_i1:51-893(-)